MTLKEKLKLNFHSLSVSELLEYRHKSDSYLAHINVNPVGEREARVVEDGILTQSHCSNLNSFSYTDL